MTTQTKDQEVRYHKECGQFGELLFANPTYFGSLEWSALPLVLKLLGDTSYEHVTCVAVNPRLHLLGAHVQIKRPEGFGSVHVDARDAASLHHFPVLRRS